MAHSRTSLGLLLLAGLWLGSASATVASDDSFKIIVNPVNPVTAVDRGFLRDAFLKKATDWGEGNAIRPINLPGGLSASERFTQEVLNKTAAQLRSYWSQRIFSGTGMPPPAADSAAAAIAYVLANPGALGYLPADTDPGHAKVIKIR